jgi:class 3 adenylate cyclase
MSAIRNILGSRARKALLHRLTGRPAPALLPRERHLTVMFTDIAGFTRLAESLPPSAVATLLGRHLGTLAQRIEGEGGTIDKIMGDGLLAFWEDRQGSAAAALRAALGIRRAVEADNRSRGLPRLRLRIGVHAGPSASLPLGAGGRLGTTLFGDTVNVAHRLEDAARHLGDAEEVTIVTSEAVAARAGEGFRFEGLGELPVRGRSQPVRAYRLAGA